MAALAVLPAAVVGTVAHAVADEVGTRAGRALAAFDATLRGIGRADPPTTREAARAPAAEARGDAAQAASELDPGEGDSSKADSSEVAQDSAEADSANADSAEADSTGAGRDATKTEHASATGAERRAGATGTEPVPSRGLRVSAKVVLELANGGASPEGAPVAASGDRPAGIVLSGVGGLGIGLRDGDVLTHAAGAPVRTETDVVSAVIGARNRQAHAISGRFWRDGEPWQIVVGLPYPDDLPLDERLATRTR